MAAPDELLVECLPASKLADRPSDWWETVLGVARFGQRSPGPAHPDIPVAFTGLRHLGPGAETCEVWRCVQPIVSGSSGPLRFRAAPQVLFGCIEIRESSLARLAAEGSTAIQQATSEAYAEIFSTLDRLGYPHVLRIWNYLPDINRETPQGERYRQFNSARRRAFLAHGRAVESAPPAACAVGSPAGGALVVYFLASPAPAKTLENPRQVSAYHYPPDYGPDSPTFSRAAIASQGLGDLLLISGTASVVGHRTVHAGDAAAQADETMTNIAVLVDGANELTDARKFSMRTLQYKVYVRHPSDIPSISQVMARRLPRGAAIIYLQADICRCDLLVEIEAAGSPVPP
ncbi:MAG: hypothetical protein ABIX37_06445 [Gammaproteobacteria bacterium]